MNPKKAPSKSVWIAAVVLCVIGAAAILRRLIVLPMASSNALDAHFQAETRTLLLHLIPSLIFVILLPLQFLPSIRQRSLKLHRWIGRIIMTAGIVAAVSALALSLHPVGGLAEGSATIFFGCFFLFSLAKAWWHIRHRRIVEHREWATRMTSIALGVATVRPIMAVFFATSRVTGLTPHDFFGPAMWLGFTITYLAGEAVSLSPARVKPSLQALPTNAR